MKKIFLLLVVIFSANAAIAQECKKSCKDKFVLNEDVIEATLYHDNGQVAQIGSYTLDNKLQGQWTSFDRNGVKTAVATYDNGKKVGSWSFYQDGVRKEVTYKDSKIANVKTWELTETRIVTNKP